MELDELGFENAHLLCKLINGISEFALLQRSEFIKQWGFPLAGLNL